MPDIDDACPSGEHEIEYGVGGTGRCKKCGLTTQTLIDWLGHEVR